MLGGVFSSPFLLNDGLRSPLSISAGLWSSQVLFWDATRSSSIISGGNLSSHVLDCSEFWSSLVPLVVGISLLNLFYGVIYLSPCFLNEEF